MENLMDIVAVVIERDVEKGIGVERNTVLVELELDRTVNHLVRMAVVMRKGVPVSLTRKKMGIDSVAKEEDMSYDGSLGTSLWQRTGEGCITHRRDTGTRT